MSNEELPGDYDPEACRNVVFVDGKWMPIDHPEIYDASDSHYEHEDREIYGWRLGNMEEDLLTFKYKGKDYTSEIKGLRALGILKYDQLRGEDFNGPIREEFEDWLEDLAYRSSEPIERLRAIIGESFPPPSPPSPPPPPIVDYSPGKQNRTIRFEERESDQDKEPE